MRVYACMMVCMLRLENNFQVFHHMGPGNGILAVRFDSRYRLAGLTSLTSDWGQLRGLG